MVLGLVTFYPEFPIRVSPSLKWLHQPTCASQAHLTMALLGGMAAPFATALHSPETDGRKKTGPTHS